MSHNTKKYIVSGLGLAAGAFAAAFGIREGVRWWRERSQGRYERLDDMGYRSYRSTLEPVPRESIPATGTAALPQTSTGGISPTMPERMPQAKPQASPGTMQQPAPGSMPPVTTPGISETTPYGRDLDRDRDFDREQLRDQDVTNDRDLFRENNLTAVHDYASGRDQAQEEPRKVTSIADTSINMDTLVGPLIDYLIAFNSIMNVLRSQQLSSTEEEEQTLGERQGMRNVLEQVQDRLPHYEEGQLKSGSLEDRTYRLAAKIRDALSNMSNTDSDFLRLYDEVQPEVCAVSQALQSSGSVSITGLDQVSQMYECQQR
jgi:hypothetical protein